MTRGECEDLRQEVASLRDRLSRLSEASLRLCESLDLDVVLQQVVDSARVLTGSRYGAMAVFDELGELESFVTSGFHPHEQERFMNLPKGQELFKHLVYLSEPFRVRDFQDYIRWLGFPDMQFPMPLSETVSFLAVPILYQGESIGNVYLAEKTDAAEFSREDEETLVMFASQAALVIANSRRYRDEQKARTGLETLVDTSPVGVMVFDARTGVAGSFNQEALRIIDTLRVSDSPPEQLPEGMTIRRGDGRKISLEEFTVAQVLSAGETVRAEEIVLTVPDGRSVTTLVNATPLHSDDGQVESVIVTMQDMSPVEDLERLRAEFLAMVSHELRTPLTSIKGSASTLLEGASSLHPAEMRQFFSIISAQAERMRVLISDLLDVTRIETGTLPVEPRPVELVELLDEARNTFLTGGGQHDIRVVAASNLPLVLADRHRIAQVMGNLLSNAARHSDQRSPIIIGAVQDAFEVAVSVTDQGQGVPADRLPHLFRKFFRVGDAERGDHTGLGLAISKGIVEAHGGRILGRERGTGSGQPIHFHDPGCRRHR